MFNGVEYRLTLKGWIYAFWFSLEDKFERMTQKLKRKALK